MPVAEIMCDHTKFDAPVPMLTVYGEEHSRDLHEGIARAMKGQHQAEALPTEPVYFILHEGVVSFVSSASVEASGIPPEQLQGRNVLDLVHPDDREGLTRYFEPGWEGALHATVRVQDVDGDWHWRRVEGVRTVDANGHASAVFTLTKVHPLDAEP